MTKSYKLKSKIATAMGGICTIITVLGINQLTQIFPGYGQYIPAIVALATWYISQTTENKRVNIAEQMVHEKYDVSNPTTEENINPECVVGDAEDDY